MRKTKIICTLGPATDHKETVRQLMLAGMNVARFNFSHGTHEEHLNRLRILKELREELGLVYSVYSYHVAHAKAGLFGVALTVTPDCEEQALEETFRVLCSMRTSMTQEELTRSKEQLKAGLVMNGEGISARCGNAARGILLEGRVRTEDELLDIVDRMTLEQVTEAAEHALDFEKLALAALRRAFSRYICARFLSSAERPTASK